MITITRCPSTLADGYNTYSNICLRKLYNGKKVNQKAIGTFSHNFVNGTKDFETGN
jgi:hypothetical protein